MTIKEIAYCVVLTLYVYLTIAAAVIASRY